MTDLSFAPDRLVLSEIFGPTLQGEGPSVGRPCVFLRLGQCNLSCVWCDTAYTWDWERYEEQDQLRSQTLEEVAQELLFMNTPMLVISGGEPMIQQKGIENLLALLPEHWWVEIETNGTISPRPSLAARVNQFNVSPKLANSGVAEKRRLKNRSLRSMESTGKAIFKFVIKDESDFDEVDAIVRDQGLNHIFIMPEGRTSGSIIEGMRKIAPLVLQRGWQLTTRLHVLLYEDARGV